MNLFMNIKSQQKSVFRLTFLFGLVLLLTTSFHNPLVAMPSRTNHLHSEKALKLGLALETRFWKAVQKQQVRMFSNMLDETFQGLAVSGVFTRKEFIATLTGKTLTHFEFINPIVRSSKNTLVISYDFLGTGSDVTEGPTVDTWIKKNGAWKMTSSSFVPFLLN